MYSLAEIIAVTQNYNRKIGEGRSCPVYYGKFPSGREVAVQAPDANSCQDDIELYYRFKVSTAFYPELFHAHLPIIHSME